MNRQDIIQEILHLQNKLQEYNTEITDKIINLIPETIWGYNDTFLFGKNDEIYNLLVELGFGQFCGVVPLYEDQDGNPTFDGPTLATVEDMVGDSDAPGKCSSDNIAIKWKTIYDESWETSHQKLKELVDYYKLSIDYSSFDLRIADLQIEKENLIKLLAKQ